MNELLSQVSNLAVQIFAIARMASVGLRYTLREILGRSWWSWCRSYPWLSCFRRQG